MDQAVTVQPRQARWADALKSADGFAREQGEIGKVWQLVGLTSDVAGDGDWIRATVGGRSIFVQRFKEELRAFENVCMHRGYPLRTDDRGNGAIRCGFHHWQYNHEGRAVSIPKCKELFGVSPRELDVRLTSVELATCGILIFARFPSDPAGPSLREYLGPGFDIVAYLWDAARAPRIRETEFRANWKLGHHISLDDYHIVAVHPKTFGKNGYLPSEVVKYFRFGRHSAYFYGADERALSETAAACRAGTFTPDGYRIYQFFPNLVVAHSNAARTRYTIIQQYVPVAHDRTTLRTIIQEWRPADPGYRRARAIAEKLARPAINRVAAYSAYRIARQDNAVCENMQSIAAQQNYPQILGKQEQRIRWFEENYADVVGDALD